MPSCSSAFYEYAQKKTHLKLGAFFLLNYKLRSKRRFNVEPIRIDVCVRGQFWAMPKTEVESVSKSKAYFETLSYKLEVHELTRTSILKPLPCRQGWRCTKLLPSFSNEKLEVHELTRKSIRAPNTDVAHYQGRRSICNISTLNYCKLTFEFFKNYIFEKRRQFLKKQSKGNAQKLCLTSYILVRC